MITPKVAMFFNKYLLIGIIVLLPVIASGQSENLSETIISVAEELAADDSNPEAAASYIEKLNDLAENPVKLNSSDQYEISRLFFLSDFQVKVLLDYTHSSGRIVSFYELVNIPGFDKETVEMMIPYITLDSRMTTASDSAGWRNTFMINISRRSTDQDSISPGSAWKMLTKYKFTAGSFSGGITTEKDPGEKFLGNRPPVPDFLSAHILYTGNGPVRRVIIGDYSARFGLGTNINSGIRAGLSITSPGYMSARDEIKAYTSTDENNFFRGVAAELSFKNLGVSLFYSRNYSDATLGSLSDTSEKYVENFYLAGIHNTPSTLQKKDAIYEVVYGINLSCNFKNSRIGFTWSGNRFSLPLRPDKSDPADIFKFEGNENNIYTFSYNGLIKRILLYSEFSLNELRKYAFLQGLSFRPSDRLTINFLFTDYYGGFISFHGKGPGSASTTGNERNMLANFTFEAAKHLFISGGCEIQHFTWLKYRCSSPTWGLRQELRCRFLPTEKITFDASFNYRFSMVDNTETSGIPKPKEISTNSYKFSVRYAISENLILGTRIEYKIAGPSGSKGVLSLMDLNYRFRQLPFTLWLRYCLFNTDSWDSRFYVYENDLLYSFGIPALSGIGSRSYIMVKYEFPKFAELRLKFGFTSIAETSNYYQNRSEIKIQFRTWF
jgi:hypothetical protein